MRVQSSTSMLILPYKAMYHNMFSAVQYTAIHDDREAVRMARDMIV